MEEKKERKEERKGNYIGKWSFVFFVSRFLSGMHIYIIIFKQKKKKNKNIWGRSVGTGTGAGVFS